MQDPDINIPSVLAEVEAAFDEYERALVSNDVPVLDRLFRDADYTLRYGAGENLYGYRAIRDFRAGRPADNLARTITARSITTFGTGAAVANIEFRRAGVAAIGRQSQTWIRFAEGWRVVAAHVSLMKG
ncbi:oxalurate catabolism protein HpxZ [Pigmentiphaga soli]|uniref:Oxalurate catabolism protein HpxZ n=1 Tax=Pigmentiphaga soli TaxID=1007095 RepID=A0ABP8GFY1_9BURK